MKERAFVETQIAYFRKHARKETKWLGVEFEHFLIDKETLRSYSYFEEGGQKDIVNALLKTDWQLILEEDGYPLGLEKNGHTITFEPGGQIEISLGPLGDVESVKKAYDDVVSDIYEVMSPDQVLASIGYHPKSKIDSLPILPKKRYQMMYEYFKTQGAKCHNMMKGTASTQVSIDYRDEMDFIKKFRVANFLAPVLAALFDSTPIFEGEVYGAENARVAIWEETDRQRSKLIKGALDTTFNFESYANYLLNVPPILVRHEQKDLFTGTQKLFEVLPAYDFNASEMEHLQSMVFPDVRLKKFIEIRMADALPYPMGLSVVAAIRTIFYTPDLLEYFYKKSLEVNDQWVLDQNAGLISIPVSISTTFESLKIFMLDELPKWMTASERTYYGILVEKVRENGSVSKWLKVLYKENPEAFAQTIIVPKPKEN